jgi:hypothetical protein
LPPESESNYKRLTLTKSCLAWWIGTWRDRSLSLLHRLSPTLLSKQRGVYYQGFRLKLWVWPDST